MSNICPHNDGKPCNVHTNGGTQLSKGAADYSPLDIPVWFNKDSLANIFFLVVIQKNSRVTMKTAEEVAMYVHILEHEVMSFHEMLNGLYCHGANTNVIYNPKTSVSVYSL